MPAIELEELKELDDDQIVPEEEDEEEEFNQDDQDNETLKAILEGDLNN